MPGSFGKTKSVVLSAIFLLNLCVLSFTAGIARAEQLPVKIYTSADGLGSSATFNLVRDSRGFIWFCSRDGLVRFDGYRFITYRIGNEDADPAVFSLLPTQRGDYWINLNRGTDYRFVSHGDDRLLEPLAQPAAKNDPRVSLKVEPLTDDDPLPTFEDAAGNLWNSGSQGINLLREAADGKLIPELTPLKLPEIPATGLTFVTFGNGSGGDFWLGTNWGLVRRLPNGKLMHFLIDPAGDRDYVRYYVEDRENRVWIARPEGIIVLKVENLSELENVEAFSSRRAEVKKGIVSETGKPQFPARAGEAAFFSFADLLRRETGAAQSSQENYLKPAINGMICASDGKIWITSNHGLLVFDGQRFQQYTSEQGLATNVLMWIAEDREGHIWITSYGGLHRINPKGLTTYDERDGLERDRIHSIYENRDGEMFVASGNFNLSRFENGAFKMVRPQIPADSTWLWMSNAVFLDSRGDWWLNTHSNVYRFSGGNRFEDLHNKLPTAIYNETNGLISGVNLRIFEDSRGDLWFSNPPNIKPSGLTRWRRETGEFQKFFKQDGLPEPAPATAFAEDTEGNLWLGFNDGGLARFRDGRFTVINEPGAPKVGVTDIFRDSKGRIWIATGREGLSRVDNPGAEHPVFRRYTIADGLASNNVRCITEDFYGNIYIGTVRGVNRLSIDTGRVKYYGTSDGLASDFINTARRDWQGTLWFGTFNGLSKLIPEPDRASEPPDILISGLRIAGTDYSVSPLGQREVFVPEQSADRNNLQIDFLSISTGGDASTRYQYRLEGVDADWSDATAQRSVTFANLSPGAYRFLVRAINADNAVSPQPAVVSFTVLRPLWQQWWFLLLAVLAVGLAIYAVYRYRLKQLIKLEQVRTRIATDLHDDIGASLSQIAILSEVVRQRGEVNGLRQTTGEFEPLKIIAGTSREMIDAMSDIVWAINPQKDHLSDLVHRMRRFAGDTLESCNINHRFLAPEQIRDVALGADLRREIYLIFKECVNNLVKHSGAREAVIEIKLESNFLTVEISDDGCGFDPEEWQANQHQSYGGNGLPSMMSRAENLGGNFQIESKKGRGTKAILQLPIKGQRWKKSPATVGRS